MINFSCVERSYKALAVVLLEVGAPEYYTLTGIRNYAGPQARTSTYCVGQLSSLTLSLLRLPRRHSEKRSITVSNLKSLRPSPPPPDYIRRLFYN